MKLQKIPLSDQLEHADIATHAKSLYQKYAVQHFLGTGTQQHKEEMFKDTSIHLDGDDHAVPVSNFLNAQCKATLVVFFPSVLWLIAVQTFLRSISAPPLKPSKLSSTLALPTCGSHLRNAAPSLAIFIQVMTPQPRRHIKRMGRNSRFATAPAA